MGRRRDSRDRPTIYPSDSSRPNEVPEAWTQWRPRPKPALLAVAAIMFLGWIGFLLAMIRLQ